MISIIASRPSCPGFESQHCPKKFRGKFIDAAEHCFEESGQRLENVDRTHLVLASGKLVLQKNISK